MAFRLFLKRVKAVQNGRAYSEGFPEAHFHKIGSRIKSKSVPVPLYGGRYLVTMLPGSGIGPEMTNYVREVFETAQVPVDFEIIDGSGEELVKNAITSVRRNRVAIKGNLKNVIDEDGFIAPNVEIRTQLDLFVYVIHYKTYPNVRSRYPNVNVVLIRQNTEGEYSMLEHETVTGVVESMKIITRENTLRLAKFAFEYAQRHGRKKVTTVHKSQQLELSDGLFLETIKEVAREYPHIEFEDIYIDHCCEKIVKNPDKFDVLLMPNLYGNIISNILCGLSGGPGLFSGVNYGDNLAIFETATRHTGETLEGQNIANPVAMLNASINMLQHLGKTEHVQLLSEAIRTTLSKDKVHTSDLGGASTTTEVVPHINSFIVENLHKYKHQF